jgi:hypothetical protein
MKAALTTMLLTLLMSMGAWADDEFPIELTCEVGGYILYFHIDETEDNFWWKVHESTAPGSIFGPLFNNDKFKNKENTNISNLKFLSGLIKFTLTSFNNSVYISINRHSLGISSSVYSGQCYKGFKEYEKQI